MSRLEDSIFSDADHVDAKGHFEHRRKRRPGRARRGLRRLLVLLLTLGLVAGATYAAITFLKPMYDDFRAPKDYPGPGSGAVKVVVHDGDTGSVIGKALQAAGVVKTAGAFVDAAKADPKASASIQPGTYTLKKEMSAKGALTALTDAKNRTVPRITIREGLWAQEIYPLLAKGTGIPVSDYVAAAKNPALLGLPAAAKGNIEGWLFPSTYEFPENASAVLQLKTMIAKTQGELKKAGVPQDAWERTLVLASLVEAEARLDVDRPKIARVFLNRIANTGKAPTFGYLQSDASISYGAHRRATYPSQAELDNRANPYNLRFHLGLPPGPISNPGVKSIQAAAHPAAGPWLFFVAVNLVTGETKYATTLAEHDAYVAQLRAWCKKNPGNGC